MTLDLDLTIGPGLGRLDHGHFQVHGGSPASSGKLVTVYFFDIDK